MKKVIVLLIVFVCMFKFSNAQLGVSNQRELIFVFEKSAKNNEELQNAFIDFLKSVLGSDFNPTTKFIDNSLMINMSNIIAEHRGGMMNASTFGISKFSYDLRCTIKNNIVDLKFLNFKTTSPVCIKNDVPCNCMSDEYVQKWTRIAQQKQQEFNNFDPIFSVIYDEEIGRDYEKREIELKSIINTNRDLKNEYAVINKYLSENKIKFLSRKEFGDLITKNYDKLFILDHFGIGAFDDKNVKIYDNFTRISPEVWDKVILYPNAIKFNDFAKSVGSKLICVKDNLGVMDKYDKVIINIKDKLLPVNAKWKKEYYKDNNVTKEEQKELESLFKEEILK